MKVHKLEDSENGIWWIIVCGLPILLNDANEKLKNTSREWSQVSCKRCLKKKVLKKRKAERRKGK